MTDSPSAAPPRATAIVLAYGAEPHLEDCVRSLLASTSVSLDVIVVDNDASVEAIASVEGLPSVHIVRPGMNTGFAGGCNLGAKGATAPVLVFVNSDAVVDASCVAALVTALLDPDAGLVCASVRLADNPEVVNAVGNPVHFLYFSWAGGFGDAADQHAQPGTVASITGATFAVRREFWDQLGGFDEKYFLYQEDVDLSMRTWLAGKQVRYVPTAISLHNYEFGRADAKFYYLERNRLINLLTFPERRTLVRIAPLALGVELALIATAARGAAGPGRSSRATAGSLRIARTSSPVAATSRADESDPTQTWSGFSPPTWMCPRGSE